MIYRLFLTLMLLASPLKGEVYSSNEEWPEDECGDGCGIGYYQCRYACCLVAAVGIGVLMFVGIGAALASDGESSHSH